MGSLITEPCLLMTLLKQPTAQATQVATVSLISDTTRATPVPSHRCVTYGGFDPVTPSVGTRAHFGDGNIA